MPSTVRRQEVITRDLEPYETVIWRGRWQGFGCAAVLVLAWVSGTVALLWQFVWGG